MSATSLAVAVGRERLERGDHGIARAVAARASWQRLHRARASARRRGTRRSRSTRSGLPNRPRKANTTASAWPTPAAMRVARTKPDRVASSARNAAAAVHRERRNQVEHGEQQVRARHAREAWWPPPGRRGARRRQCPAPEHVGEQRQDAPDDDIDRGAGERDGDLLARLLEDPARCSPRRRSAAASRRRCRCRSGGRPA